MLTGLTTAASPQQTVFAQDDRFGDPSGPTGTRSSRLDELITNTYELGDLSKAFQDMRSGRSAKGVILL